MFCRRHRARYPRRVSAAKTCPGTPETRLCSWGRDPNGDRTPTAAGPPAPMIPASDDARQRRQQPRQAERRTGHSPDPMHSRQTRPGWTTDRPPPRTTGTQVPPTPATIDSSTEDTTPGHDPGPGNRTAPRSTTAPTAPRQRTHRPNTRRQPHAAQDAHRTRQRRPTTIYTRHRRQPARTPDSGPRWTAGPAADSYNNSL